MNAVEKIEAAIQKLEQLKEASTQPTGAASWYQGQDRKHYERATEVYSGPDEYTPGSCDIVQFDDPADAELVVTLHRTIGEQLSILRMGRDLGRVTNKSRAEQGVVQVIKEFADAILGEVSS